MREVLRKLAPVVRQPPAQSRSIHNRMARNTGARLRTKRRIELTPSALQGRRPEAAPILAVTSRRAVGPCLRPQIKTLEKTVPQPLKPTPA